MPLEGYLQRVLIVTLGSYLPMVFVRASHCVLAGQAVATTAASRTSLRV